jgi:hypothetical protein
MFRPIWAVLTTAATGAATWVYVARVGNRREAWDSEVYFIVAIPLIGLTAAVVSFFAPSRFWRWAMLPFLAQALVAFLQNPGANMLPIGLIVFAILGVMCMVPAALGAAIGRRFAR